MRREDLVAYLKAREAEGYTLVGAEQTAQSVSLEEFTFPDRTVVVLGWVKLIIKAILVSRSVGQFVCTTPLIVAIG